MDGKETSNQHFEWVRTRIIRERNRNTPYTSNRTHFLLKEVIAKHGDKAAKEIVKEFNSKSLKKRDR